MGLRDEQRDCLALTLVPGVGSTLFIRLLAKFGTPGAVLGASVSALGEVVGPKVAGRIYDYRAVTDVSGQDKIMSQYDASRITMDDTEYPTYLSEIYDPPLVLFSRGELLSTDRNYVAVVGTRKASPYGLKMAEQLSGHLAARGITVVSGLASGVDAAAHRGALEAGGRTLAVLGCGVDLVYPTENAALIHDIIQQGCVLSPFAMGVKPNRGHFPNRNRIISGMSLGTLVIEAPPGSGALITAQTAAEQGREVFALPGQAGQRNSLGPHALIREGAKLVETVEDILVELNLEGLVGVVGKAENAGGNGGAMDSRLRGNDGGDRGHDGGEARVVAGGESGAVSCGEKDVLAVLNPEESFVDEIALACRISVSKALSSLTMLELKGLVRQFSGKRFAPR